MFQDQLKSTPLRPLNGMIPVLPGGQETLYLAPHPVCRAGESTKKSQGKPTGKAIECQFSHCETLASVHLQEYGGRGEYGGDWGLAANSPIKARDK